MSEYIKKLINLALSGDEDAKNRLIELGYLAPIAA